MRLSLLHPYRTHVLLLAYTPALLVLNGLVVGWGTQVASGVVTFLVLWACLRRHSAGLRLQAIVCVPVATAFEVLGSLVWGGYHYRLHDIPLYVPPGHALVYVFGATAAALPLVRAHGRLLTRLVLAVAATWAVAGVTVMPLTGHRLDVLGLSLLPLFAWCILRSRRPVLFAGIWLATALVEIVGTLAGNWMWEPVAPWSHLAAGNPPSAIAAGYAIIDGTVVASAWLLARLVRERTPRRTRDAHVQPVGGPHGTRALPARYGYMPIA